MQYAEQLILEDLVALGNSAPNVTQSIVFIQLKRWVSKSKKKCMKFYIDNLSKLVINVFETLANAERESISKTV